ncbi:hypothetical protein EBME_2062 [bacterium endosymbiont of Mortierella elongata FMR23-6]|nr:hypothetical protein EBME_2062 [bacterium endosymbiont of Mortierella elongata FMR23-6]
MPNCAIYTHHFTFRQAGLCSYSAHTPDGEIFCIILKCLENLSLSLYG